MPATKKQVKQGRLKARAENDAEAPMRRIRAAKSLLLLSNFTRDPSRIARRTANLYITDGAVSEDVRAAAAKLLELVSSHAVNENEEGPDDELPAQFQIQIQRPKKQKPKFSLEAIRNGDDLGCWFWEVLMPEDPGFPATESDIHTAKIRARQILLESGMCANRTERDDEVLQEFRRLVREILIDPASATRVTQPAESATPIASPEPTYGIPMDTPYNEIRPRPELSVPPIIGPEQSLPAIRITCRICQSTDKGLATIPHDCGLWQNGATP